MCIAYTSFQNPTCDLGDDANRCHMGVSDFFEVSSGYQLLLLTFSVPNASKATFNTVLGYLEHLMRIRVAPLALLDSNDGLSPGKADRPASTHGTLAELYDADPAEEDSDYVQDDTRSENDSMDLDDNDERVGLSTPLATERCKQHRHSLMERTLMRIFS